MTHNRTHKKNDKKICGEFSKIMYFYLDLVLVPFQAVDVIVVDVTAVAPQAAEIEKDRPIGGGPGKEVVTPALPPDGIELVVRVLLVEGGVDLLWIETMSDLDEVEAAFEGAREVCDLEVAATLSFETKAHTMMGVSPTQAIERLRKMDLVAIGANCGTGSPDAELAIEAMRAVDPVAALIAKPNAGLPTELEGEFIYSEGPAEMAKHALRLRALGAGLIGGCCGSTPDHLRAMASALELDRQ